MKLELQRALLTLSVFSLFACAKEAAAPAISVQITNPTDGSTVTGTAAHITLGVSGIELAPAAEARPGTAHHHLYLDVGFPGAETAIPMGMPGVVHLGQAQTEFHWDSLAPGQHRIIAVLADPAHVPIRPFVTDTVTFTVVAPPADTTTKK
jgi:hypothetical protein